MIIFKTAEELWEGVLGALKTNLKEETYNLWIKPLKPLNWENALLTSQVPNRIF
ncbi:MAG: hypothetical protein HY548_01855 [Elusimicrobia bacterium]|nr:hypothetical protein [Elusimicrobiota bacterium]